MKRRNILFMHVDQLHWQALSAYGNPHVNTPNMDRIVAEGHSFRGSYSAMPQCCPARASWYTGRMSSETGVPRNPKNYAKDNHLRAELPDLGQWLSKHGNYKSTYAGKWHVPGRDVAKSFDVIFGSNEGEYADAGIARACLGFLENYDDDKPFFLNVGFMNPHDCCFTAGAAGGMGKFKFAEEIEDQLPPLPKNFEKTTHGRVAHWTELDWRYYIYIYYRWVEMVDAEIGRLYDGLMDLPLAANTVVIFTSDHGDGVAFHGNIGKDRMEEESWRVPTIIVDPDAAQKGVRDEEHLSIGVDIPATICDYANVPPLPNMTIGKSLRPLVQGGKADRWRDHVVGESFSRGEVGIRDAQYKTIFYCTKKPTRVFDLKTDPLEMSDLAKTPAGQSVMARHRACLHEFLEQIEPFDPGSSGSGDHKMYLDFYSRVKKEVLS